MAKDVVEDYIPRYPHSYLVKCLNCGIKWERITIPEGSTYPTDKADIQYNCPKCGSNAFQGVSSQSTTKGR